MDKAEQHIHIAIGERLKAFRKDKGLNQHEFAKKLDDFNQSNLSKIERGERYIDSNFLHYLLKAYPRFSLDWLILGELPMEKVE